LSEAVDDYSLMEGIAQRRPEALRALYDRHAGVVLALCCRMLRDRSAAEDLLIDTFYEIWERSSRYQPHRAPPLAYLLLVARTRALDRLRSRTSESKALAPAGLAMFTDPLNETMLAERRASLKNALQQLEPLQREAIECSFYDGLSHGEIAEKLNKPLGTIKSSIRQGLIRLRDFVRT